MKGFHVSASGAIQGHHGPLVYFTAILSFIMLPLLRRRVIYWFTFVCLSFCPSITNIFVTFFLSNHCAHQLKLSMVLQVGVQHVAYRMQVRQWSTSCFLTEFSFGHCMIFYTIFSSFFFSNHNSH